MRAEIASVVALQERLGLDVLVHGEAERNDMVEYFAEQLDGEGEGGDVLSDDRIVEVLKEAGVDIARRTVAKYREALRIPSSVQRRRMLKAG